MALIRVNILRLPTPGNPHPPPRLFWSDLDLTPAIVAMVARCNRQAATSAAPAYYLALEAAP